MKYFVVLLVMITVPLFTYDVDEEELQSVTEEEDIEFINYEGPHETVDTVDEIRGVGVFLAGNIDESFSTGNYFDVYRLIHAVDPEQEEGLDADIFIIEARATVDHIKNVRRMIDGYLSASFGYSTEDAALLAEFISIYNAVYRGNIEHFGTKYKDIVMRNISAENAGIALHYKEWPGKTRMLVPLSADAANGRLSSLDPSELTEDGVIEELRTRADMGIETRKAMVELKERIIEEEEKEIAQKEAELEEKEEGLEEEQTRLSEEREQISEERQQLDEAEEEGKDVSEERQQLDQQETDLQQREETAAEQEAEIEEDRADLEEDRQELAEKVEDVQEDREEIARDQTALLEDREAEEDQTAAGTEAAPVGVKFILLRNTEAGPRGKIVLLNSNTGTLLKESTNDMITGRSFLTVNGDILAISADSLTTESGRLTLLDATSLEEKSSGENEIFVDSILRMNDGEIYAVVRETGNWFLGRFNTDLDLVLKSSMAVNPYTFISFMPNKVFVQEGQDGDPVVLRLDDLKVAPK